MEASTAPKNGEKKRLRSPETTHNAVCDGCDCVIVGVRRQCAICDDFDLCNECWTFSGHQHVMREVDLSELVAEPHQYLFAPSGDVMHIEAKIPHDPAASRAYIAELEAATGRRFKLLRGAVAGDWVAVEEEDEDDDPGAHSS